MSKAADRLEFIANQLESFPIMPVPNDLATVEFLCATAELVRTMEPSSPDFNQDQIWDEYRKLERIAGSDKA